MMENSPFLSSELMKIQELSTHTVAVATLPPLPPAPPQPSLQSHPPEPFHVFVVFLPSLPLGVPLRQRLMKL